MSETYTVGGDTWQPLAGSDISAQTFTPIQSHIIYYVDLNIRLWSTVPPEIAILACDASHTPIGSILSYGHPIGPLVYLPGAIRRVRFLLTTPLNLLRDSIYSIWIYKALIDPGPPNWCLYDKDDATYPRGHIIFSNDGGNTWTHFDDSDFIFCEFGAPPSPDPVADPPIENFAPVGLNYIPLYDGVRFCLATSVPCHLTCFWTDVPPRKHRTSRIIRGLNAPWDTYFCFVAWREVEQNEPGDTLYHTFDITPWPLGEVRYFTFRGEVDDVVSPSVGPIFDYFPVSYRPTPTNLFPNGPGDVCYWRLTGNGLPCPDHWQTVNNDPPLDDALMLIGNTINHWWGWEYYTLPPQTYGQIGEIIFHIRCKRTGSYAPAHVYGFQFKTHGTAYQYTIGPSSDTWHDYTMAFANNPFTGNPWTEAELNALQAGIALRHTWGVGWTATGHCSQVRIEVNQSTLCPIPD